jgi:sorting nexin-29
MKKSGMKELMRWALLSPLERIWIEEKLPEEWKKTIIIKLPKTGNITNCNNWREITFLSIPSKVLSPDNSESH